MPIFHTTKILGDAEVTGQFKAAFGDGNVITNLNADLLDGQHGTYYAAASSLASYLPLTGGILTGNLTLDHTTPIGGQANSRSIVFTYQDVSVDYTKALYVNPSGILVFDSTAISLAGHTHGSYNRATSVLSGANVFSDIVVTDGIVTAISTRALTAADLSAVPTSRTIAGTALSANISRDTIIGVSTNGFVKRTGANTYGIDTTTYNSGAGTANQIAYYTAANTMASLSTATYPSLTELSYVKGVTSAIQTQLDNRVVKPTDYSLSVTVGATRWCKLVSFNNRFSARILLTLTGTNTEQTVEIKIQDSYYTESTFIEVKAQSYNPILRQVQVYGNNGATKTLFIQVDAVSFGRVVDWKIVDLTGSVYSYDNTVADPTGYSAMSRPVVMGDLYFGILNNAETPIVTKSANYTIDYIDKDRTILMQPGADATVTIPPDGTTNFTSGFEVHVVRYTGYEITIGYGSGVSIYSEGSALANAGKRRINAQNQAVTLKKVASNTWLLLGALKT